MAPILYLIIPCYNEEKVLPVTGSLFLKKLYSLIREEQISGESRILYVNDGSVDRTWKIIQNMAKQDRHCLGIRQSRNRGHQNALLAGLMEAKDRCDIAISMDCDGQDDVDAIDAMIGEYKKGSEVVYGVRSRRNRDSFFKKASAEAFYRVLRWMGAEVVFNHGDYRLVSNRVLRELANFQEVNIFLRGIFPLVGFQSTCVYYERKERMAGKSHYPLKNMLALALDGITSLSVKPIRMITFLGFFTAALGLTGILWTGASSHAGLAVYNWAGTVSILGFLIGIQLISLGIIGEYVGKIYLETKKRPRYIISERTEDYPE